MNFIVFLCHLLVFHRCDVLRVLLFVLVAESVTMDQTLTGCRVGLSVYPTVSLLFA